MKGIFFVYLCMTKKKLLAFGIAVLLPMFIIGQPNSNQVLQKTYRQYKNRFFKHFIVQDRHPSGCINDGIGLVLSQDSSACYFTKEGYGLPATNLYISPNGAGVVGRRLNHRMDGDCNNFGISWFGEKDLPRDNPDHRFNWLDFGSETLTQSGWMFVFLATEYEIARRQGDKLTQDTALENIFLGLQAIRRLDMHTQHLLDRTYAKRSVNQELICADDLVSATHIGWWNNCHRNWDARVKKDKIFTPDYSGYNGFMIRCDAGQNLEDILHDPTDESWNVDAIGGAFGGINSVPLDACKPIDSLCYLVNQQHFVSHDQIINLFYGFLFLKKFIPQEASITTCAGKTFHPISMMQKISNALVTQIKGNHIVLPNSKEICGQWVKLSECEGGDVTPTLYGLKKANEVLQDSTTRKSGFNRMIYNLMPRVGGGFNTDFYYKQIAGYTDFSFLKKRKLRRLLKIEKQLKKEILLIGNDVLFPKGKSMADEIGGQKFYQSFLANAPLDGPCHDNKKVRTTWPYGGGADYWPQGFDCDNIVNWEGNRWSSNNWDTDGYRKDWAPPMRSNGLDYLALYNIYILRYWPLTR